MAQERDLRIAILGSAGVPASYGGFETLADNLTQFHARTQRSEQLTVYCSDRGYPNRRASYENAALCYSRLPANGALSILYDGVTLRHAARNRADVALLLGVSGAITLPSLRRRGMRVVTHVDGLEWRREKWSGPARAFLRWSERLAVRHSDAIVADSPAIAEHLQTEYGVSADVIAYGGDHAVALPQSSIAPIGNLPDGYALALCRIEPENNVHLILEAFATTRKPLVFVGNWDNSAFGRRLRATFASAPNIRMLDPIYASAPLYVLRHGASAYVHGHSAGGTNPALVEMMHVGHPIFAFDCVFNRDATRNNATFFSDQDTLATALANELDPDQGAQLQRIARQDFTWDRIGATYFELFARVAKAT